MSALTKPYETPNIEYWEERVDLAAALRWTARLNMHEAVAKSLLSGRKR